MDLQLKPFNRADSRVESAFFAVLRENEGQIENFSVKKQYI